MTCPRTQGEGNVKLWIGWADTYIDQQLLYGEDLYVIRVRWDMDGNESSQSVVEPKRAPTHYHNHDGRGVAPDWQFASHVLSR